LKQWPTENLSLQGQGAGLKIIIKDNENGFIFDYEKNPGKNLFKKLKFVIDNKDYLNSICQNAYLSAKECSLKTTQKKCSPFSNQ
jgi:hypothetical protein